MPPRSVKMKRFIFGFQRRVWWPKWTPASSRSRMDTTAKGLAPFTVDCGASRRGAGGTARRQRHPHPSWSPGRRDSDAAQCSCGSGWRRGRARAPAARSSGSGDSTSTRSPVNGWSKREPRRVQELPLEAEVARDAVDRVAADRQLDRLEVDADLVRAAGLEPHLEQRARAEQLDHLEVRHRVARRRRVERVARSVDAGRGRSAPRSGPSGSAACP